MSNRVPANPEPAVIPDADAARLLARASELDAARRAGSAVADLRWAATEAGISAPAFDAALAELQAREPAPATDATPRSWLRRRFPVLAVASAALMGLGALAMLRESTAPSTPTIEEAFGLRCIPAAEAAELVRPLLQDPASTIRYDLARAPRELVVRTTPAQMERVRETIWQADIARTASCPR